MLRRTLRALCALCLVALTVSCGSSYAFLHIRERAVAEAECLKAEAAAKNLEGEEITTADRFLEEAKSKSHQASADLADRASAYYRIALARKSVEESASELKQAEAALAVSREQVEKYQDILTRVSAGGQ